MYSFSILKKKKKKGSKTGEFAPNIYNCALYPCLFYKQSYTLIHKMKSEESLNKLLYYSKHLNTYLFNSPRNISWYLKYVCEVTHLMAF